MEQRYSYIKPVTIEITNKIIQQMSNCICKVKNNENIGTGFFCIIPYKNNNKIKVLITSYQIINEIYIQNNMSINLLLGDYNENKIINLNENRNIYFNQYSNTTIIELKDYDNINNFLELDDNLFRNDLHLLLKNESIYILQHLIGGKALVSYGIINILNEKFINHICYVGTGAIGAPILNLMNNKVIGISLGPYNTFNNFNVGILLKYAIEEFINKYQNNIQQFPNILNNNIQDMGMNNNLNDFLMPNIMINNNNNFIMPNMMMINGNINQRELNKDPNDMQNKMRPKITVSFKNGEGLITNLIVDYGISIKNLFILYLRKINKQDLIGVNNISNIISFFYDGKKIRLGDETPVNIYFKGCYNPIIYVKFTGSEDIRKSRNIKFKTTSGHIIYRNLLDNLTIKQVLDEYLEEVNKKELIDDNSNKICFLYNGNKIKSEDMNLKVFEFFKNDFNPIIVVNDPNNLIGDLNKK